jgi:AraC-like DNA-binding protein
MYSDKYNSLSKYNSAQPELGEWLNSFSAHLQIQPHDNRIEYPDNFAKGFAKVYEIENGLTYRIVDYQLHTNFISTREPSDKFFLIIYFYQYTNCSRLFIAINDEVIINSDPVNYSTLLMTNSRVSQRLEVNAGACVKGLTIQLSEEWLKKKIQHPATSNYILFKQKNFFQDFLTAKTQKLVNEIFDTNFKSVSPSLYLNTRVLRLLESFLENILHSNSGNMLPVPPKDFQSIIKIEALLLENYDSAFPKIGKLARIALMSETKLKNVFKKAFGMGMYEYYQKNRMHKAKELLNINKYSVSEVGTMIGYQNLSNFSNAFRKEFGHLPKNSDKIG